MRMFVIVSCVIVLGGCGLKKQFHQDAILYEHQEIIARCSDLPDTPFQVQLKKIIVAPENHDQMQIFYTTTLSVQDIIFYYEQQMERLGWQLLAQSKLQDAFLCYGKPEKFCSILIFEGSFRVYVGNK